MSINKIYKSILRDYLKIDDNNIKYLCRYKESVQLLRNSYKSDVCKPLYNSNINRDGYMLAYFPYYAILTSEVVKRIKKYINIKSKLDVSIFGCGPGPEVIGISNEIDTNRINYNLFDYEMGWKDQREFAKEYIKNNYKNKFTFCEISGCDLLSRCEDCEIVYSRCVNKIRATDLFVMQNCLNHITNEEDFIKKISFIVENAKSGAVFLFIDLKYNISRTLLNEIFDQNKHICIKIDEQYNQSFYISEEEIDKGVRENLFTGEGYLKLKKRVQYMYLAIKKI